METAANVFAVYYAVGLLFMLRAAYLHRDDFQKKINEADPIGIPWLQAALSALVLVVLAIVWPLCWRRIVSK